MRKKRRFIGSDVYKEANQFAEDFGLVPVSIALIRCDNRYVEQLAVIFEVDEERRPK